MSLITFLAAKTKSISKWAIAISLCSAQAFATYVTPQVYCVENLGDGIYKAHWSYNSEFGSSVTIPAGTNSGNFQNYFSPGALTRLNQTTTFLTGLNQDVFTTTFTSSDTWTIQVYAHNSILNRSATASAESNRCGQNTPTPTPTATPLPVKISPIYDCSLDNKDGTVTAYFGYKNEGSAPLTIPVGIQSDGSLNYFEPGTYDRGQPTTFSPGEFHGAFGVTIPSSIKDLHWYLQNGGAESLCQGSNPSKACGTLTPKVECIDDNPDGTITAHFSYQNDNIFSISIPLGLKNTFSPSPQGRGQPTTFLSGTVMNAFSAVFDPKTTPSLTWTLLGTSVSATVNSPLCKPNTPPVCKFEGSYQNLSCAGADTSIQLDGSASIDPEGAALTYKWTTTCTDAVIDSPTSAKTTLHLKSPGKGLAASCQATLQVVDQRGSTSCGQSIQVNACNLDCLGQINGSAKLDSCGVCNGNNACVDCAGTPNGMAKRDQCGVCGGNNSCFDCSGVPNGTATQDRCGVCNGNGQSCLGCVSQDVTSLLFSMDGSGAVQKDVVYRAVSAARALRLKGGVATKLAEIKRQANSLYVDNWTLTWSLPQVTTACSNQVFCAQIDNGDRLSNYQSRAQQLRDLVTSVANIVKAKTKKLPTKFINLEKEAGAQYDKAISASTSIPRNGSVCSK